MTNTQRQLHSSATHAKGFDPACPVCNPQPKELIMHYRAILEDGTQVDFTVTSEDIHALATKAVIQAGYFNKAIRGITPIFMKQEGGYN